MWQAHAVLLEQQHASFFQPATPFSKVNIFKASNFPSSRVSKAIAKFPFFKGIQGQSIQLAFCIGIQGQSIKLLSFKGIQVQSITLPLLQGYQRQSIKFPFLKGIQRQRLQLPFFKGQRRTPARCPQTSRYPILWCHFGTQPFGCNPWADAEGEARNLAHKIFIGEAPGALWIQIPAVFHQMLKRMKFVDLVEKQPLFLLPPLIEEGVGVQEPFGKGESLCPFFNG